MGGGRFFHVLNFWFMGLLQSLSLGQGEVGSTWGAEKRGGSEGTWDCLSSVDEISIFTTSDITNIHYVQSFFHPPLPLSPVSSNHH